MAPHRYSTLKELQVIPLRAVPGELLLEQPGLSLGSSVAAKECVQDSQLELPDPPGVRMLADSQMARPGSGPSTYSADQPIFAAQALLHPRSSRSVHHRAVARALVSLLDEPLMRTADLLIGHQNAQEVQLELMAVKATVKLATQVGLVGEQQACLLLAVSCRSEKLRSPEWINILRVQCAPRHPLPMQYAMSLPPSARCPPQV